MSSTIESYVSAVGIGSTEFKFVKSIELVNNSVRIVSLVNSIIFLKASRLLTNRL